MNHAVYACDIGSVKSDNFAWSRVESLQDPPIASGDIDELLVHLVCDAQSGASVALGFEAPLFMPVPSRSGDLSSGRPGEKNRSMFAPAGLAVTTLGLHEAAWILRGLRQKIGSLVEYYGRLATGLAVIEPPGETSHLGSLRIQRRPQRLPQARRCHSREVLS